MRGHHIALGTVEPGELVHHLFGGLRHLQVHGGAIGHLVGALGITGRQHQLGVRGVSQPVVRGRQATSVADPWEVPRASTYLKRMVPDGISGGME